MYICSCIQIPFVSKFPYLIKFPFSCISILCKLFLNSKTHFVYLYRGMHNIPLQRGWREIIVCEIHITNWYTHIARIEIFWLRVGTVRGWRMKVNAFHSCGWPEIRWSRHVHKRVCTCWREKKTEKTVSQKKFYIKVALKWCYRFGFYRCCRISVRWTFGGRLCAVSTTTTFPRTCFAIHRTQIRTCTGLRRAQALEHNTRKQFIIFFCYAGVTIKS